MVQFYLKNYFNLHVCLSIRLFFVSNASPKRLCVLAHPGYTREAQCVDHPKLVTIFVIWQHVYKHITHMQYNFEMSKLHFYNNAYEFPKIKGSQGMRLALIKYNAPCRLLILLRFKTWQLFVYHYMQKNTDGTLVGSMSCVHCFPNYYQCK